MASGAPRPSVFSNRTFLKLYSAQVTSLVGGGLSTVALALLAYELADVHAGVVLGIAMSMRVIAFVVFAPIFGGLAHRLPRKQWLVGLDVGRALVILCLPWVDSAWQLYALMFLLNIQSAGFTPVFQAVLPEVLPNEKDYTQALAHSRTASELERILSPSLAAVALFFVAFDHLFFINVATFIISAWLIVNTTLPDAKPVERTQGLWHNSLYGVKAFCRTPRLQGLLGLHLVVAASGSMVIVNSVGYVQGALGLTEQATAWVLAVSGLGAIVAARSTPTLIDQWGDRTLLLGGGIVMCLALPLGLLSPNFWGVCGIWFLIGFGSALVLTPSGRVLNQSCQSADRNAYFAANFALSHAMWLLAYPVAGWLSKLSFHAAFVGLSALALLGLLAAYRTWPQKDTQELAHTHPAVDHEHWHDHQDDEHHQHTHEGWEGPAPHSHPHHHAPLSHRHRFVIDEHHTQWPKAV